MLCNVRLTQRLPEHTHDLLDDMTVWPDNGSPAAWYYLAVQEATNSHYYDRKDTGGYETWRSLRQTRQWVLLEKTDSTPQSIY